MIAIGNVSEKNRSSIEDVAHCLALEKIEAVMMINNFEYAVDYFRLVFA